jgi:hypothetical protein
VLRDIAVNIENLGAIGVIRDGAINFEFRQDVRRDVGPVFEFGGFATIVSAAAVQLEALFTAPPLVYIARALIALSAWSGLAMLSAVKGTAELSSSEGDAAVSDSEGRTDLSDDEGSSDLSGSN